MRKISLFALLMSLTLSVMAQTFKLSGVVLDQKTQQGLPGALAIAIQDGQQPKGETTDLDGKFSFSVKPGKYTFRITYLGYSTYEKVIDVKDDMKMGTIRLKPEDKQLDEVKAVGVMQRQEQRGDTTVFNAEAFKVNPDATTEDLIKKMPGMQVSGGQVKSGGEQVKKVLVDGKEYFGDDPMAALRNISADMVKQIEVYDKASDQSQFTGFSDGNEERTINILTKMGISSGRFGRVYAGYGTDDRYSAGGNLNMFRGNHRVSLIGMLNNINEQNFSFADVSGAMSNGGGMGMMGMGGFSAGRSGKNRTGSIGINYTYEKEDTIRIEFSYLYKNNKNNNHSTSTQEYFLDSNIPDDSLRVYQSETSSDSKNDENSASLRMTWTIDKNNSIIFSPRITWQDTKSNSGNQGDDSYDGRRYLYTWTDSRSNTDGASGSGWLMWRHKFDADHRTLSLSFNGSVRTTNSDATTCNVNDYAYGNRNSIWTSQITTNESNNSRIGASLMYTEPMGENFAWQINYSPSYTYSKGDKIVEADTTDVKGYNSYSASDRNLSYTFSSILSNKKSSDYWQQKGGIGLNFFKGRAINASAGLDIQHSSLEGEQIYPSEFTTSKEYTSILPSFNMRVQNGRKFNMHMRYRTSTSAPSITQLQKTVDVSNIRSYSGGNEDLNQSYSHNVMMFMMANNPETSRGIFFNVRYSATKDYIATATYESSRDSVIDLGIILPAKTEYRKPINIDGYWTLGGNLTLSSPVKWLGSNVNLNFGANMSHTPGLYKGSEVQTDAYTLNGGITIGSSFSENADFTVSYDGAYNINNSTLPTSRNYDYYSHTIGADFNFLFFSRLVLATNFAHNYTNGMDNGQNNSTSGTSYDKNYVTLHAAIAYKFFADRRGELRLKVNDILDNTSSVTRTMSNNYVTTSTTDVLRRYALLTFTYKIKAKGENKRSNDFPMGPPPPGMRGPRGGGPGGPRF